jgi:hypothetical protein
MHRRAGRGFVPHWSHNPGTAERCEADRSMTMWHYLWCRRCEDEGRIEATVGKHRADVLTRFGWTVEFQHSNMTTPNVHAREDGWGGKLIWVHDAMSPTAGTLEWKPDHAALDAGFGWGTFTWIAPPTRVRAGRCHQLADLGDSLVWLSGHQERSAEEIRGRCYVLEPDHFTATWLNGDRPLFPPGWAVSRWKYEQGQQQIKRQPPKPRSQRLATALQDAEQHTDDYSCDRATQEPRMAVAVAPRPCIDCTDTPRVTPLSAIPHGYSLCDAHWPEGACTGTRRHS